MAVNCKVSYFTLNTSTGNQSITGVGFQPKAIIFFATGQTSNNTSLDLNNCIGMSISSSARKFLTFDAIDDIATSDTQRMWNNFSFQQYVPGSSTVLYRGDFVSFDSNGFTINILSAPTSAYRVGYFAVGGDDITNTAIGDFDISTGTGTQSVTGVGFQPDFLFAISAGDTRSEGSRASDIKGMIGFTSGSGEEGSVSIWEDSGLSTTEANTLQRNDYFISIIGVGGTTEVLASLDSFDSDGFTIQKDTGNDTTRCHYLAIKGGEWHVNYFSAQSSTGTFDVKHTSFTPKGVFMLSAMSSNMTSSINDLKIAFGGASSNTDTFATGGLSEDGLSTTSNCFRYNQSDKVYTSYDTSGSIYGQIELYSFLSDGFTLDQTNAESPTQSEILYFAVGQAGYPIWVNVSGTWKQVTNISVNKEGTWKNVSGIDVDVSGTWKGVL